MLDLSLMRGVWVDPIGKIAHAQAGCLIGDVDRETQLHGLATVLGFVSLTGIAGLTLGGGIGYLTRRFGWTVDNVVGMDVVTAQGQLVRASADENAELFWGLKGGGGNFGVVTGFDYRLYPVGPQVLGGFIAWPASEAPKVVELFRKQAQDAPDELTLVCIMRPAPPAPWLPKEAHGTPVVMLGACYTGNLEQGEKLLAPIKTFGAPLGDNLVRRPYSQLQTLLDSANPKGRRCYWRSEYLPAIEPAMTDKFIEHAAKIQSPFSAAILFQLGGALAKLDDSAAPAGNRDAGYVLNLPAAWTQPEDDQANIQWVRQAWDDLKAYSTGAAYINFLSDDEGPERTQASYGENMNRLAEIKAKWDPQNFFRSNRNIVPALVTMTSQR